MNLSDKVVVVTGGARGIGRALVRRFAAEKPLGIVVADRDTTGAVESAREVGGLGVACDVSRESEVQELVAQAIRRFGRVDLFCANAGVGSAAGINAPEAEWQRLWNINVMSQVFASRAVLPAMLERGSGYLLFTASAAGLLTMIGDAPYSVTKHASVALAEWLSVTYGDRGIRVSCLCPQFVNTDLLKGPLTDAGGDAVVKAAGAILEPEAVAESVVAGIGAEQFLILPHPEVATFYQRRATDTDRWIKSMRKLQSVSKMKSA